MIATVLSILAFSTALALYEPLLLFIGGVVWLWTLNAPGAHSVGERDYLRTCQGHSTSSVCACKAGTNKPCKCAVDNFETDLEWVWFQQVRCLGFRPSPHRLINSYGRCTDTFSDCTDCTDDLDEIVARVVGLTQEEACGVSAFGEPFKPIGPVAWEALVILAVVGVSLTGILLAKDLRMERKIVWSNKYKV
mmetsp:Transcript_18867/g.33514  ORF Transcript_18867/g.33514 Transcript_18867/m.33514 type:complete len:192 (-) Transcript_18867:268-843(-)